ncbi:hypothetical protein [Jiangella asiatica]|uniref:Cell division protein CrgA n=1 Tax=Jiangella asiatica TaxID=2530372 RepID=A0A4R5DQA5_9ACTN|nr:hypothetical protein [Jiangella asiatica]TDE12973.1 hypothetical protein E1269_06125 [Jiangella asiatica]
MSLKGTPPDSAARPRRAGLFDIRVVIAGLFGIFGLVLLAMGLFATSDADLDKADGINVNLWTGVGLLIAAAIFAAWTWLRPVVVTGLPDDRTAE